MTTTVSFRLFRLTTLFHPSARAELDVFIAELDEDVEGMQSTIYLLQQQLREARTQMTRLQTENQLLKSNEGSTALATVDPQRENHSMDTMKKVDAEAADEKEEENRLREEIQDAEEGRKEALAPAQRETGSRRLDEVADATAGEAKTEAEKAPVTPADDPLFTLTVKESERQEFEDGFGDHEEEEREAEDENNAEKRTSGGKNGRRNSGGRNKEAPDGHHHNNNGAASVKRPHSPEEEEKGSKGAKSNGNDVSASHRSSRSNNVVSSPAKRARGGSGSRSRGRRMSVDDAEDDHDAAADFAAPSPKGRSPRAGARTGSGTRATRGNAVVNGDSNAENGMDCD